MTLSLGRPANVERTPRLRARRIPVDISTLGPVRAELTHGSLGKLEGEVRDLSLHGVAVALPATNGSVLFTGDRFERLEVVCDDRVLFRGKGTIRRVGGDGERIVVGIELEDDGLDLAELHRHETRRNFAQRLEELSAASRYAEVSPAFKAWVADLHGYLTLTREFLGEEELALASEDQLTRQEAEKQYLAELAPRFVAEMAEFYGQLGPLVSELDENEHTLYRAYFRLHVLPLLQESPLLRRSFEKPLGYAGDYEMMNMLYRDHAEGHSLFAKALNIYGASESAARANINRIDYLGAKIREEVAARSMERVRLASIGCGPSREIAALLQRSPEIGRRLDIALIDQEERSMEYCERTLAPLARQTGAKIHFVRESVRRLISTRKLAEALGERELIYSAGLFDYISDRSFGALAGVLYGALSDGGTLAIGNVAMHNPSRHMMEYYLDWFLIHRTEGQLLSYGEALQPKASAVRVDSEPTGVNLFLIVTR